MRIALNVANSSYSCSGQNTLIHVLEAVNAGDWSVGGRLALFSAVLRPSHERQGGDVWTTGVPTRSPSRRQRPLPVWGPSRSRTPAITASSLARAGAYCRRSTNHAKQTWARAMLTPPCTRGPCSHARSYSHARSLRYFDIVDGGDLNVLNANIQLNAGKVSTAGDILNPQGWAHHPVHAAFRSTSHPVHAALLAALRAALHHAHAALRCLPRRPPPPSSPSA